MNLRPPPPRHRRPRFRKFLPVLLSLALLGAGAPVFAAAEADLAVTYSAGYAASVGGEANAQVAIANAVAGSNAINDQSGTGARLRIVGYAQSLQNNTNNTTTGGMVGWLGNYDSHVTDVVDFGNAVGADLVTYVCQNSDSGSIAAVAQVGGKYSALNPGAVYFVVVAHEIGGHNYGLTHADGLLNPKTVMLHNYCGGGANSYFTNPNIWLNGVQLLGDGNNCGQGGQIAGGDEAYFLSNAAQGVADRTARLLVRPKLDSVIRRWTFNSAAGAAPAGTVIADQVASASAIVRGNGAAFTGKGLRLPGGTTGNVAANAIAAYIDLPNGLLSANTNLTIEVWATPLSAQNWGRILEFGRPVQAGDGLGAAGEYTGAPGTPAPGVTQSSDGIMLTAIGTDLNQQRFEAKLNGAAVTLDSNLPSAAGVQHHYVITFTDNAGGGRWQWFRDGQPGAYLDVSYHLSALEDVNNWLGRSLFTADAMANHEYAEVRISSVALSARQVLAHYLLGPNYAAPASVTLNNSDANGANSFNAAGQWSNGAVPSAGNTYETFDFLLRTPATGGSFAFGGGALKVSGGDLRFKGTGSGTITVSNLTLNGAAFTNAGAGTCTLAGGVTIGSEGAVFFGQNAAQIVTANLSGSGPVSYVGSGTTLSGTNTSFTGKTRVGDGRFGTLTINSEARLGANPATFTSDQLALNRGVLASTATMDLDDANRGILIDVDSGIFNVAPGTTLTVAVPLTSALTAGNVEAGSLVKENTGTLVLTHANSTHKGPIQISAGALTIGGAGRINSGNHTRPITNNGTFTYGSSAAQTLAGVISGTGLLVKSGSGMLTLGGNSTYTGTTTVNAGTLQLNGGNTVGGALSGTATVTVNSAGSLALNNADALGSTAGKEALVINGGTVRNITASARVTLWNTLSMTGGTLTSTGSGGPEGAFSLNAQVTATADSNGAAAVISGAPVSLQNRNVANGSITFSIARGSTLPAADLTVSARLIPSSTASGVGFTKTGPGILQLNGANTYTGATAINAGTVLVNGSLAAASTVTVAGGATLGGLGTISGATTFSANSTHTPGNVTGTQTFVGPLSYAATARVKWTFTGNGGPASQVAAGSVTVASGAALDLVLNAAGSTVNYFDTFWTQPRSWTVLSSSSSGLTGALTLGSISADAGARAAAGYGAFSLLQSAAGVTLAWTPKPFAAWRGAHFAANAGVAAISDFLADPDGDGLANAWEYFHDTDPNVATASALLAATSGGRITLTFPRSIATTDALAKIQGTDTLTGLWTDLAQSSGGADFTALVDGVTVSETGAGATRTVAFSDLYLLSDPAHPQRYFRLWLQLP